MIYREINALSDSNSNLPNNIKLILNKLGYDQSGCTKINDIILVRKYDKNNYVRASYEIIEKCNYRCQHCYLEEFSKPITIPLADKKAIIDFIERAGCIWLQITGGEPLIDPDFFEIYSYSFSKGLLVTISTNGSLLCKPNLQTVFEKLPPYRITLSLYGASAKTYESLTRTRGSYKQFIGGLEWLKNNQIRTRVNIIITHYNYLEYQEMIQLVKKYDFEYHIFPKIHPTLLGDKSPLELMADNCCLKNNNNLKTEQKSYHHCFAGKTFFHVDSIGMVSICKIAREKAINIFQQDAIILELLPRLAHELLNSPECDSCRYRIGCKTCLPLRKLYEQSGIMPQYICKLRKT